MAVRELKYPFAFDEQGNVVSANEIDELIKNNKLQSGSKYFISWNEDGQDIIKRLDLVKSKAKRKHFREHKESNGGNKKVEITSKKYNETIVHKLAKQIIANRDVEEIYTPNTEAVFSRGRLLVGNERFRGLSGYSINKEVVSQCGKYRFDIEMTDADNNKLVIEIKVTHETDKEKIEYLKKNKIDAIEIDMSDIYEDMNIIGYDISEKIKSRISGKDRQYTKWLSHKETEEVIESINNILKMQIWDTKFRQDRDGKWYVYANDEKLKGKLELCPYKNNLSMDSPRLFERDCVNCERFIGVNKDLQCMLCNQSKLGISKVLSLIYNINT